jgi:hypothetical protein
MVKNRTHQRSGCHEPYCRSNTHRNSLFADCYALQALAKERSKTFAAKEVQERQIGHVTSSQARGSTGFI